MVYNFLTKKSYDDDYLRKLSNELIDTLPAVFLPMCEQIIHITECMIFLYGVAYQYLLSDRMQ